MRHPDFLTNYFVYESDINKYLPNITREQLQYIPYFFNIEDAFNEVCFNRCDPIYDHKVEINFNLLNYRHAAKIDRVSDIDKINNQIVSFIVQCVFVPPVNNNSNKPLIWYRHISIKRISDLNQITKCFHATYQMKDFSKLKFYKVFRTLIKMKKFNKLFDTQD